MPGRPTVSTQRTRPRTRCQSSTPDGPPGCQRAALHSRIETRSRRHSRSAYTGTTVIRTTVSYPPASDRNRLHHRRFRKAQASPSRGHIQTLWPPDRKRTVQPSPNSTWSVMSPIWSMTRSRPRRWSRRRTVGTRSVRPWLGRVPSASQLWSRRSVSADAS